MKTAQPLKPFLERLLTRYHRPEFLHSDPLEFVHHYQAPHDREAVALVSALLAYGNVKQIRASVRTVLAAMERADGSPASFVEMLGRQEGPRRAETALSGFYHRWNRSSHLVLLLRLLGEAWRKDGSLGSLFCAGIGPEDADFTGALDRLIASWKARAKVLSPVGADRGFLHLLTAPSAGSTCKRWCMFLRWMGRSDELDPGLWTAGSPLFEVGEDVRPLDSGLLVIPLDTHTGRISQYLGLTARRSLNWKAALEVTAGLRRCDPDDPVKYDFALSRLGILDLCQKRYRVEICEQCDLVPACNHAKRGS